MLLLELEEQIKPLSRRDKLQLMQFLQWELRQEIGSQQGSSNEQESSVQQEIQNQYVRESSLAVSEKILELPIISSEQAYPWWSQYAAYDAAASLLDALRENQPPL